MKINIKIRLYRKGYYSIFFEGACWRVIHDLVRGSSTFYDHGNCKYQLLHTFTPYVLRSEQYKPLEETEDTYGFWIHTRLPGIIKYTTPQIVLKELFYKKPIPTEDILSREDYFYPPEALIYSKEMIVDAARIYYPFMDRRPLEQTIVYMCESMLDLVKALISEGKIYRYHFLS